MNTKIICTISDHKCDYDFLKELYEKGMNVVRINSAHSTIEGADRILKTVRMVSPEIPVLLDTKGPEIRLTETDIPDGIKVDSGEIIEFHDDADFRCTRKALNTNCSTFVRDVPVGSQILIDDGNIEMKVIGKDEGKLICTILNPGIIRSHKSINVPGVHISLPSLTDRDKTFIRWAVSESVDFIAHSFVRSSEDLREIREMLARADSGMKIISKIENQQGIDNIDEIIEYSFGIMIARGDLGVEIAEEKLPMIQRNIVEKCRISRKPVIIATQMLHSMIENPRPTRAEVTDVANAIIQRTDAVMLSGETAAGRYPAAAVETMRRIAAEVEKSLGSTLDLNFTEVMRPIAATLARNLVEASDRLPVKAIIADTWTGRTCRYLSEFRPKVPVYALCYRESTMREMGMVYGVRPFRFMVQNSKEEMVRNAIDLLVKAGEISKGDLVGFIGGSFNDELGATYMEFRFI